MDLIPGIFDQAKLDSLWSTRFARHLAECPFLDYIEYLDRDLNSSAYTGKISRVQRSLAK